ncbi:MAG: PaaI family thioesterase [Myxococcales bacterium]|nr:PaaI family thioesterase [Myxococcales bacterium]
MKRTAAEIETLIRQGVPEADEHGLHVEAVTSRGARVRYPFKQSMVRPGGTVAGPALMGLADAAMYAAVLGHVDEAFGAVTAHLAIHFLRRPKPVDVVAESELVRLGRRLAVLEVRLYSAGESEPVALVTGSYALPGETVDA